MTDEVKVATSMSNMEYRTASEIAKGSELSLTDLDTLAVSLEEAVTKSKSKSFLVKQTTENETVKLQFDVVLDVLKTKSEELEQIKSAREIKAHNAKILALIAEKQEEGLKGKSIEDLEKLLK